MEVEAESMQQGRDLDVDKFLPRTAGVKGCQRKQSRVTARSEKTQLRRSAAISGAPTGTDVIKPGCLECKGLSGIEAKQYNLTQSSYSSKAV